jgi:hypothetical protein
MSLSLFILTVLYVAGLMIRFKERGNVRGVITLVSKASASILLKLSSSISSTQCLSPNSLLGSFKDFGLVIYSYIIAEQKAVISSLNKG